MSSDGWFVAGPAGPVGPYDVDAIKAGVAAGGIIGDTPVWREGRSSWDRLADIPELAEVLVGSDSAAADPQNGAAATTGSTAAHQAVGPASAAAAAAAPSDDPMAEFAAEISAIEAEVAAAAEAEAAEGDGAGPSTPDELEFEDDDGTWYAWDAALRKYTPKGGPAGGGGGGGGYDVEAMTFAGDDEVLPTLAGAKAAVAAAAAAAAPAAAADGAGDEAAAAAERKRKRDAIVAEHREKMAKQEAAKKEHEQRQQQTGWFELKTNTSVYVTGLPCDTDEKEVAAFFSKCGIIKEGPDAQPKIKLYRNKETGDLKGDALVTYLKGPSVQLATTLLDGTPLREGSKPLSVTEAKFEMKGEAYQPKQQTGTSSGGGNGQQRKGSGKRGGKGGGKGGRGGTKAQLDRLEKRLGWGGFDDSLPPERVTVILTGMFDPRELESQLGAAEELEVDVKAECTKMGPVEKVRVFKGHPAGVVSVRFRTEEGAQAALARMNGRFFAGRQLGATLWDGVTNYNVKYKETAEEEAARLDQYTRELEAKEAAAAAAAAAPTHTGGTNSPPAPEDAMS